MSDHHNRFCLDGRRALVTGGSQGIGAGIARGLAEAGADLVLVARSEERLTHTAHQLRETGRQIDTVPFDLFQTKEAGSLMERIVDEFGSLDILVNVAGTTRRAPAEQVALDDWRLVLEVNLTAVFAVSQAFARHRIALGGKGKIINIGSLLSSTARQDNAPYAASKGGILMLTKALAVDWARHGILVNAIGPGYIETPLTKPLVENSDFDDWVKVRCPLGRWGHPGDLAGAAVFLAAPASDFITGQMIYVDGGWLARF